MAARAGKQFLERLRSTKRQLWLEGERVDDVTAHPALAGAAHTLAGVFDRQHAFPDDCLIPDPETGEPINIGHMIPRSVDDLKHRNRGLLRIAEATVGLMGRTPDYMSVKFASFASRWKDRLGADHRNEEGPRTSCASRSGSRARISRSPTRSSIRPLTSRPMQKSSATRSPSRRDDAALRPLLDEVLARCREHRRGRAGGALPSRVGFRRLEPRGAQRPLRTLLSHLGDADDHHG